MQFFNYLKYPIYLFSIVNNLLLILTVSSIKEMVFIPDADVIKIDEGTVKSEKFCDGKGDSKLSTTDGMYK